MFSTVYRIALVPCLLATFAAALAGCLSILDDRREPVELPSFMWASADVLAEIRRSDEDVLSALYRLGGEIALQRFSLSYSTDLLRGVHYIEGPPPTTWYAGPPENLLGMTAPTPMGILLYNVVENQSHAGDEMATLLHEICHVIERVVHGRIQNINGGHGPRWTACMDELGLEPDRYASRQEGGDDE